VSAAPDDIEYVDTPPDGIELERWLLPPGNPALVSQAIRAIDAFQVDSSVGERGLRNPLSMWTRYDHLTPEQIEQVVAHYTR
jgi:hypothetical protein